MRTGTQDTCGAILTLNFKDGDGDIGRLNPTDTMPPYNSQSPYRYDLTMVFLGLAKGDNQFRRYYDPNQKDSFQLGFTIKSLPLPVGANKAITGQILTMIPFPFYPIGLQPAINFTAIRFDVFIYDRNFHKSNVVSTGPIPIF